MSDTALTNAMARRDELASEIEKLNQRVHAFKAEIRAIDAWVEMWHAFADGSIPTSPISTATAEHSSNKRPSNNTEPVDSGKPERTRATGNPKKEAVAAEALEIIRAFGSPVSRADLYEELAQRGMAITGKDPEQVLSTMLWRAQKQGVPIVRLRSGGYWLADEPHFESGYDPLIGEVLDDDGGQDADDDSAEDESRSSDDRRDAQIMRDAEDEHEKILASLPAPPPPPPSDDDDDDDDDEEAPQPSPPPQWRSKNPYD